MRLGVELGYVETIEKQEAEIARLRAELAASRSSAYGAAEEVNRLGKEINRLRAELAEVKALHDVSLAACDTWRDAARRDAEQIARLRKTLEPFAEAARWYDRDYCTEDVVLWQSRYGISVSLKVDHLWAARTALAPRPPEEAE